MGAWRYGRPLWRAGHGPEWSDGRSGRRVAPWAGGWSAGRAGGLGEGSATKSHAHSSDNRRVGMGTIRLATNSHAQRPVASNAGTGCGRGGDRRRRPPRRCPQQSTPSRSTPSDTDRSQADTTPSSPGTRSTMTSNTTPTFANHQVGRHAPDAGSAGPRGRSPTAGRTIPNDHRPTVGTTQSTGPPAPARRASRVLPPPRWRPGRGVRTAGRPR